MALIKKYPLEGDKVKITKCEKYKKSVGFCGTLYRDPKCFFANTGNIFPINDFLMMNNIKNFIGIIGEKKIFWWTEHSDFDVEIEFV